MYRSPSSFLIPYSVDVDFIQLGYFSTPFAMFPHSSGILLAIRNNYSIKTNGRVRLLSFLVLV
jgi:hypothetical protein